MDSYRPAITRLNRERRTSPGVLRDLSARTVPYHTLSYDPYFRMSREEAGIDYNALDPFQPVTPWEELEDFEVHAPVRPTHRPTTEWGEACEPPPLPAYDGDADIPDVTRRRRRKPAPVPEFIDYDLPAGVVHPEETL